MQHRIYQGGINRLILTSVYFASILCLIATCALAQQNAGAMKILERSIRAEVTVPYKAIVEMVIYKNGRIESRQIHELLNGVNSFRRVRVTSGGPRTGALILRTNQGEWEFRPGKRGEATFRTFPPSKSIATLRLEHLSMVRHNLQIIYLGKSNIAGRTCDKLEVRPAKGKLGYKKLWVDSKTGVELRWERYGPGNKLMATWTVTSIDYNWRPQRNTFNFVPPPGSHVVRLPMSPRFPLATAQVKAGFKATLPTYIPPGYVFDREHVGVMQFGPYKALWLEYINGLDHFSLFQSEALGRVPEGLGRAMRWDTGLFTYFLAGELPQSELEKIKKSTQY